jgi:hypothetical protein
MKKRKIIHEEDLHPFICYMPLDEALCLLEDYIKADLTDEQIYKKYDMEDLIGEEPLKHLVPDFQYEGDVCPTCKKPIYHRVTDSRKIESLFCPDCEEPPNALAINAYLNLFFSNNS